MMNNRNDHTQRTFAFIIVLLLAAVSSMPAQHHPSTIDSLISLAADKNNPDNVRLDAVRTLGNRKKFDTAAVSFLIVSLSDGNLYLLGEAALSLGRIGKRAVPYLLKALQDTNDNVRWGAAISLGRIGGDVQEAVPFLTKALADPNENVRWCSLIALGNIGKPATPAASEISKYLHDPNEDIKWGAAYALSRIQRTKLKNPPNDDSIITAIGMLVPRFMKELHIPGVSVCLLKKGKMFWSANFGVKDARNLEPVTSQTMFEACSMSKPVFAYLVMKLAEEKKLDLDKPLTAYLDEQFIALGDYGKSVTARMILCHTSGFPNWRKGYEETNGPLPVYFKPGTQFGYSGEGYFYLQRVVEKITGKQLDVYAQQTLFAPLGLKHISYAWTKDLDTLIASGHDTSGAFLQKTKYVQPNAAYSLYTSAEDFASIIGHILDRSAKGSASLSEASRTEMMRHQIQVLIREPIPRPGRAKGIGVYWGLGWAIDSTITENIVYHSGANQSGFRCYAQFNYSGQTAIVIMTNGLNGSDFWRRVISAIGDF
ncbi:MAG: serine hydrolase [Bacteroidota bacterium]